MRLITYLRNATKFYLPLSTGIIIVNTQDPSICAGETRDHEKAIPDASAISLLCQNVHYLLWPS